MGCLSIYLSCSTNIFNIFCSCFFNWVSAAASVDKVCCYCSMYTNIGLRRTTLDQPLYMTKTVEPIIIYGNGFRFGILFYPVKLCKKIRLHALLHRLEGGPRSHCYLWPMETLKKIGFTPSFRCAWYCK